MTECPYSRDALRLLYAIGAYSNPEKNFSHRLWMKFDSIYVLALLGVRSGAFEGYDVAPALFPFRGIKMFAMISQEAVEDVQMFFRERLVDKILLNTWFYATITGLAVTAEGQALLDEFITDEDRKVMDEIIYCRKCRHIMDFAVTVEDEPKVHLVMTRVCRCQTKGLHTKDDAWGKLCPKVIERIEDFFSIGQVEYRAEPYFLDTSI